MSDLGNKEIMAQNIRYYMDQKHVTRNEMCSALGVKYTTLTDWVKGKSYPRIDKIELMANYFGISKSDLVEKKQPISKYQTYECVKIPILGRVAAGIPIDAIENIIGYEDIPAAWAKYDEYFALKIKGDSMLPDICDGDIVVVRVQPVVDNGQIAIVCINGETATCKRVMRYEKELCLVSINPAYETMRFTPDEVNNLPVTVLGKVIEIRRKL